MKNLYLFALLFLTISMARAQTTTSTPDTVKKADSVYIPYKYRDIHKRSPVLAGLLSLYIPGLGQLYNKQELKAGIVFGTWALSFGAAEVYASRSVSPYNSANRPNDAVTVALLLPFAAATIYSVIDAPITANRLNRVYHLGKKKRSLSTLSIEPGLMNLSPNHYAAGISLVLK
ncbi:MAG TPA: DUF5683 domain-containing protein [Mucilaginibacter sp.]|jgi:TM2 domain-containing membrane protein YozV|nr:DUF5683 domain-containing protein [Mucilaginibacter sp.]